MAQCREKQRIVSENYEYVIKKLMVPHHKIVSRCIGIHIPEICFYKEGEADSLYMSTEAAAGDVAIVRVGKEKLSNTQIQKILNEKRRKYRDRVTNPTRRKVVLRKSQFGKKEVVPETKDAVVVKYLDGYEQLIS